MTKNQICTKLCYYVPFIVHSSKRISLSNCDYNKKSKQRNLVFGIGF